MLLTLSYVKQYFPLWSSYCLSDLGAPSETVLQNEISLAEDKIHEYIPELDESNITPDLKLHLLNIVRKRCLDRRFGDTEFQQKPQIIKDYEDTIAKLQAYLDGTYSIGSDPDDTDVRITAKIRRFNEWFNN